jgi:hypothetical protein
MHAQSTHGLDAGLSSRRAAQGGDDAVPYIQYGTSQRSAVRCIITLQIAYMSEISSRPLFPLTTDHKSCHTIIFPIREKEEHSYRQALPRQRETSASEVFGRDIRFEATARTSPLVACEVVRHIPHVKQVIIQHLRLQIHKRKVP